MQYRTFMEKFGASSKEQIQLQMRSSIRINTVTDSTTNKRKSLKPAGGGDEMSKRVKTEATESTNQQVKEEPEEQLDESTESVEKTTVVNETKTKKKSANTEFSCDYCSGDVSFPIFNLLVVHIKNEHASEFILTLKFNNF